MKLSTFAFCRLGFLVLLPRCSASTLLRGGATAASDDNEGHSSLLCRMVILDTLYDDGGSSEELACIPIINDKESDDVVPIHLPADLEEAHATELEQGRLHVKITNAEVTNDGDDISITGASKFSVAEDLTNGRRHLQDRALQTFGETTLAIVRIRTRGASPSATRDDLELLMNPNEVNLRTQLEACSVGKVQLKKADRFIIDVSVNQPASAFAGRPNKLIRAVQTELLRDFGDIESVSEIADRIMFVAPPGTGKWSAYAVRNHWRSVYNDKWVTSLSATMHELGHTFGLGHANALGKKYKDTTGYMGHSDPSNYNWPRRCYNGRNSYALGWYADKTIELNGDESPHLIDLATIVDYEKATTVLVKVKNMFLMYNRATTFNQNTGEWGDSLTVTEDVNGTSDLRTGLRPDETYKSGGVVIEACKRVYGDGNNPDMMVISVGKGGSACDEIRLAKRPASASAPAPVRSPPDADTPFPTASPP